MKLTKKTRNIIFFNLIHCILWIFVLTKLQSNFLFFIWGCIYSIIYGNILESGDN